MQTSAGFCPAGTAAGCRSSPLAGGCRGTERGSHGAAARFGPPGQPTSGGSAAWRAALTQALPLCQPLPHLPQTFLQPPQAAATQRALGRRLGLWVVANTQRSNSTTKKRTTGPPTLPPINDNGSGGGGGWDGHKIARNLALNAFFLGIYFLVDSGGPGGIFNGGNGGGGGEDPPVAAPAWSGDLQLPLACSEFRLTKLCCPCRWRLGRRWRRWRGRRQQQPGQPRHPAAHGARAGL